ncbi:MAG: hypothetical protein WCS28_12445 [Thiomicrospira sp.]
MTDLTSDEIVKRSQEADGIISDFEAQHSFTLPEPWRATIAVLLLGGLIDPHLHRIFETLKQVEYEAGRLAEEPADYKNFNDE